LSNLQKFVFSPPISLTRNSKQLFLFQYDENMDVGLKLERKAATTSITLEKTEQGGANLRLDPGASISRRFSNPGTRLES
jgi:hypothetical protein